MLNERQIALLERHSTDFRCRHVESSRPGELLNQDTFYWGTLKGVGKAYVQVVVDVFCSLAFAKLYTSKMPITATDLLYDRVLLLAMEGIDHRTTKVRSPRTNGFVERMNRTLLDECFRIGGRSTWYESVEQLQADLDQYLERYNLRRSHQDYRLAGRTPTQALADALSVTVDDLLPLLIAPKEDQLTPAA